MRRLFPALLAAGCLAAFPHTASAFLSHFSEAADSDRKNPASDAALRDVRIYIDFEPGSGYENDADAQADFRRAAVMALRMYESIFPAMRVFFVHSPGAANITFHVGDYAGKRIEPCGVGGGAPGGSWYGCSYVPGPGGGITGGTLGHIYFNTTKQRIYHYDRFTYFSRDGLYDSYRPATNPPYLSGPDGAGWIDGYFSSMLPGTDASHIVFHEFGHTLGLGHATDDPLHFYGYPPIRGEASPYPNRHIAVPPPGTPHLPPWYFGAPDPDVELVSDLRPLGMYLGHMLAFGEGGGKGFPDKPPGVPVPHTEKFNFRVVHPDHVTHLKQGFNAGRIAYPHSRGLIRLQQSDAGPVALTSSWAQAINKAQLDAGGLQVNPYFVTSVHNGGQVQRLASGASHTLAIRQDGSLWAWGSNANGQLGINYPNSSLTPVRVGQNLQTSGLVWVAVAAGENFSLALRSDNALFAWGERIYGQVGDGIFSATPQTTPKQIPGSWASVKAGEVHALGLKTDGTLWGWGANALGQLGNGNNQDQASPVQETSMSKDWVAVSAGTLHSLGMKATGKLHGWGWNQYGTLGNQTRNPSNNPISSEVYYPRPWLMPDAGHEHSAGLAEDGMLYVWGRNQLKQLGPATASADLTVSSPVGSVFVTLGAGHWHNAAIKRDGTLWTWGYNSRGQLGNSGIGLGGTSALLVQEATGSRDWVEVIAGKEQTFAMRADGTFWAWGANGSGQLGDGTTTTRTTPVPIIFTDMPSVTLLWGVTQGEKRPVPNDANVHVTATTRKTIYLSVEVRGRARQVQYYNGSTLLHTSTTPPYSFQWSVGRGTYSITARMTDAWLGSVLTTPALALDAHQIDFVATAVTPSTVNLTTEAGGSTAGDWLQYGYRTSGDYITRRNISVPLIVPKGNPFGLARYNNSTSGFTWSNGYPAPSTTTPQKQYLGTTDAGVWDWEVPASNNLHTVKVYAWIAPQTTFNPAFSIEDVTVGGPEFHNSGSTPVARVFAFTYAAAKAGAKGMLNLAKGHGGTPSGVQAVVYK